MKAKALARRRRVRTGKRLTIPPRRLVAMFLSAVVLTVALCYAAPFFYRVLTTPTYDNALYVHGYKDRLLNYATHETLKTITINGNVEVVASKAGRRLDEIIEIYEDGEQQTFVVALLSGIVSGVGLILIWIQAYAREEKGSSTTIVAICIVGSAVFMNWTNVAYRSIKDREAHLVAQPQVQGNMALLSFAAIQQNVPEMLSNLMNRGTPLDAVDLAGNTYFHHAAEFGRVEMLRILASYPGGELDTSNIDGETPVQLATEGGYGETIEFFLSRGVDSDNADLRGRTLLHRAAVNGDTELLTLLLKYNQGLGVLDEVGNSPMSLIATRLDLDTVSMLLSNGADVNSLVSEEATFFEATLEQVLDNAQHGAGFDAVTEERVYSLIRRMLEMDADPTRKDADGNTPLHHVVQAHDADFKGENILLFEKLTALLIEFGASTSTKNISGTQALPLAHVILHNYDQWLDRAIEANRGELNSITINEKSLFQFVVEKGNAETLTTLLENGLKTKPWEPISIDPIKFLVEKDDLKTASVLLEMSYRGPDSHSGIADGPLHVAARRNSAQMIELLLKHGYDVNAQGSRGNTPLHYAVDTKSTYAILTLIENQADPLIWNSDGDTPMKQARELDNQMVIDVLKRAVDAAEKK